MPNVEFSEILFDDDTLIFAAPGSSTEAFLWAIESVSSAYGLKLTKGKFASLAIRDVANIMFSDGQNVPRDDKTEYLGGVMDIRAYRKIEVNRRIANARYISIKLRVA